MRQKVSHFWVPAELSTDPKTVEIFERSLGRCLDNGDFLGTFYRRFLSSSEMVREKFQDTDLEKQKKVLRSSLHLVARAALQLSDGVSHLQSVARTHARRQLDIPPSLYELWLSCLIQSAREHDPEFTTTIEDSWNELLAWCIQKMVDVYRDEETLLPPR